MNRLIFNLLLILFISLGVLIAGTDGTIRGKITDTDGAPLPGANIYVPALGVGAAADMEGNYIGFMVEQILSYIPDETDENGNDVVNNTLMTKIMGDQGNGVDAIGSLYTIHNVSADTYHLPNLDKIQHKYSNPQFS